MKKSKIVQNIVFVTVALSLLVVMLSVSVSATSQSNIVFSCTEFDSVRGETFTTTIYAQEGSNVTGLNLTLKYNSEYVTLVSYDVLRASEVNVNGNTIEISYADADNVTTELELVELTFSVDDNLSEGLYPDWLVWSNNSEDDAFTTTGFNNGTPQYEDLMIETAFSALFIRQQGDAYNNNYDGKVNARDASYILQHAAHMFTMPAVDQRYANVYTNDNLSDGTAKISARDASLILQYAAHMDVALSDRINVTFYALDESGNYTVQVVKSVKKGSDLTKLPSVLSKGEGKEGSWSASAEGFIAPDFTNITESLNIYAHYEDAIFNITYDYAGKQGAYAEGVSNPVAYTEKDTFVLYDLEDVPGYTFAGWYNNYGDKITEIKIGTTGDITLTAQWELQTYTITYYCGKGTNSLNNISTYNVNTSFTFVEATLKGCEFYRWVDQYGNTITKLEKGKYTEDLTLTAEYTERRYLTVSIDQIDNPKYDEEMVFAEYDSTNNVYTYVYYLGYVANVPLTQSSGVSYGGISDISKSLTVTSATTTSIEKGISSSQSYTLSTEISSTITAKEEIDIPCSKTSIEASISASLGTSETFSQLASINEAKTKSEELSNTTSFTLPDGSPIGYYRVVYMGTLDMFVAVVYDPEKDQIDVVEYSILRDDTNFALDYSQFADFSGHRPDKFDFIIPEKVQEHILYLSEGSDDLVPHPNGNECIINEYSGTDTDIIIPTYLDGMKVTSITSDVFAGNTTITSVTLGEGITSIPEGAFEGCTSLTTVIFNGQLTEIGANAFKGCSALEIEIPNTVTTIGDSAFDGCVAMDNVLITNAVMSLGTDIFNNCGELSLTIVSDNFTLIQSAVSSGAKNVYVDWIYSEATENANFTLVVPAIQTFKLNGEDEKSKGACQKFKNLYIVSDAIDTTIEFATITNDTGENVLTFASTNVNLRDVSVESNKTALVLSADSVNMSIGGTVTLTAKNGCDGITANNLIVSAVVGQSAEINVTGGAGSPGGCGMEIANTVTFNGNLTAVIAGGEGIKGTTAGSSGGDGGIAIYAETVIVNSDKIISAVGGRGGDGAQGATGSTGSDLHGGDSKRAGTGGTGGTGGKGGAGGWAINPDCILVVNNGQFVINNGFGGTGGKGGTGGTGGHAYYGDFLNAYCGRGGHGGTGGKGGQGGDNPYTDAENFGSNVIVYNGSSAGGAGGTGGSPGGTNSDSHDGGSNGEDGSDGEAGIYIYG